MRIMIDTNVLISAYVLSSSNLLRMIKNIKGRHTIVLPTYVLDELKRVTMRKFPEKYELMESFLRELPYELVSTPEKIDKTKYPGIRDKKDLPILASAIFENVDVLISGDEDFAPIDIEYLEILTPRSFVLKYC